MTRPGGSLAPVRRPRTLARRSVWLCAGMIAAVVLLAPPMAQARIVSSAEQIEQNKKWNGKTLSYRGEVVGDVLLRGDFAWINVNDDAYQYRNVEEGRKLSGYNSGQSIWLPAYLTEGITYVGRYSSSGDKVEVTGVFHAACPEHGGDMDIHAASLEIIERGDYVGHRLDLRRAVAALLLLSVGTACFFLNRRAEARRV